MKEPTKQQLLDIAFRLMGFQLEPNEDKFSRPSKKYAHRKGKQYRPSMLTP